MIFGMRIIMIALSIMGMLPYLQPGVVRLQPEQIHLAYGDSVTDIVVTWSTRDHTNHSIVEYGIRKFDNKAFGSAILFENKGDRKYSQYIHRVTLWNLTLGQTYIYHCGSELGWSAMYYFKTLPASSNRPLTFAVFGDLGNNKAVGLPQLQREAQNCTYDAIIHIGDFAYDLHTDHGRVGDEFMKQIETVAAYVPYMTCPGNHEKYENFSHYRNRFSMPGLPDRMYYSFDIGPIHFISLNTEAYFTADGTLDNSLQLLSYQYTWLEKDLEVANMKENREKHPWIMLYMHKPMYCSDGEDQCTQTRNSVRDGLSVIDGFGLEKLLFDNGVDLVFVAHEHSYERTLPVYKGVVYNGSAEAPYTNPRAPVHIKTGSIGAETHSEGYRSDPLHWSAFRTLEYGYTKLTVYNKTHLHLEQTWTDKPGQTIDDVWLIQEKHAPFG